MKIVQVIRLLDEGYGQPQSRPKLDPLSELVATILSQNTSDANSGRAYRNLIETFGNWDRVADAGADAIAAAIASGGLSLVKAPRIKSILEIIRRERGSLDMGFLADMPLDEAREWLQALPGVGPKTAACVLLFSLGRPSFPVDTHVYRVAKRVGLISNGVSPAGAHQVLEQVVPQDAFYRFHMNLVRHGRQVCRAQRPRCGECVLREICNYAKG